MGDIIDQAQDNDELFRQVSLGKHFAGHRRDQGIVPYKDRDCLDCGDPITKKRLKANPQATRCVECQTEYERKGT